MALLTGKSAGKTGKSAMGEAEGIGNQELGLRIRNQGLGYEVKNIGVGIIISVWD
jgi:hypothetical protein